MRNRGRGAKDRRNETTQLALTTTNMLLRSRRSGPWMHGPSVRPRGNGDTLSAFLASRFPYPSQVSRTKTERAKRIERKPWQRAGETFLPFEHREFRYLQDVQHFCPVHSGWGVGHRQYREEVQWQRRTKGESPDTKTTNNRYSD